MVQDVAGFDYISGQQLLNMLYLQDKLNGVIRQDWISADYPYLRAVIVEVGEAIEHYGWKWWKKQNCDLEQVQIELVDILHFYLSKVLLEQNGDASNAASCIMLDLKNNENIVFDGKKLIFPDLNVIELLELMAGLAAAGRVSFSVLQMCMRKCGLSWEHAFEKYVAKNILNLFRQAHGYNNGTYVKMWNGVEDNVRLSAIMKEVDPNDANLSDVIWVRLENEYSLLK